MIPADSSFLNKELVGYWKSPKTFSAPSCKNIHVLHGVTCQAQDYHSIVKTWALWELCDACFRNSKMKDLKKGLILFRVQNDDHPTRTTTQTTNQQQQQQQQTEYSFLFCICFFLQTNHSNITKSGKT